MAPEIDALFCEDVSVENILMLNEVGICFNICDGQIGEVIF